MEISRAIEAEWLDQTSEACAIEDIVMLEVFLKIFED